MTSVPRLRDLQFVDLYLGATYADIKDSPGSNAERRPVPNEMMPEIGQVRVRCTTMFEALREPQFALLFDDVLYRVTVMHDLRADAVFFLRRMTATIRPLANLGLPNSLRDYLMAADTRGLILLAGDQAAGKTSTAASLLAARLQAHGSTALAIEDPPETQLDGLHGHGRCIQVPASARTGTYGEQLRRAMRTGVSMLLIGEIRDHDTASEAIRNSINGLTVISTIHAKDTVDALMRLVTYAANAMTNPADVLSKGLAAVIHQRIERIPSGGVRLQFRSLQLDGTDADGIRSKIRSSRFDQLSQDIENQTRRETWA